MELVYVWVPGYDTKARDALARAIEEHKKVLSDKVMVSKMTQPHQSSRRIPVTLEVLPSEMTDSKNNSASVF
jgi:hypothetical protein